MQSHHKIFFSIAVISVVTLSFSFKNTISLNQSDALALAQEVTTISTTPSVTQINLLEKIEEGKRFLKKSPSLKFNSAKKQIALAILDKSTGKIFERRLWVRESDIKAFNRVGSINLEPDIRGEPLVIKALWWNSFNTPYEVSSHPEMVIVANKYLFPSLSVPYPQERSKSKYSEIIYSPYSEALRSSELTQAGKEHIDKMVDSAFESLELRKVQSISEPGKLVTDIVSKDFIKNIIVVEHVDPDAFRVAGDGGKLLIDRVLAIVGANKGYAYSYTGSPAGASGIAQFIKPTYDTTRKKYLAAGLIQNFSLGMADHINAFKSMVLFFDSHKKELENKVTRKDALQQLGGGVTEEMLALAYNGGPGKVVKSVNSYGLAWISGQLNFSQPAIFRKETLGYFNKFKAIKSLNIF